MLNWFKKEIQEWTTWCAILVLFVGIFQPNIYIVLGIVVGLFLWSPDKAGKFIARWVPKIHKWLDAGAAVANDIKNEIKQ